jgi:hypothetical protein
LAPEQAARRSKSSAVEAVLDFVKEGREEKRKAAAPDYFAAFMQQKARTAELENKKLELELAERELRLQGLRGQNVPASEE